MALFQSESSQLLKERQHETKYLRNVLVQLFVLRRYGGKPVNGTPDRSDGQFFFFFFSFFLVFFLDAGTIKRATLFCDCVMLISQLFSLVHLMLTFHWPLVLSLFTTKREGIQR